MLGRMCSAAHGLTLPLQFYEKRYQDAYETFEKVMREDARENSAFVDTRALLNREATLLAKTQQIEQMKMTNVKLRSRNGHLKDGLAMMSGALSKSIAFYDQELKWLQPRLAEAESISKIFNETVRTVEESTGSLVQLFQMKGKELQELQKLNTDDEADRKILQVRCESPR
jgi:hypothetical protein